MRALIALITVLPICAVSTALAQDWNGVKSLKCNFDKGVSYHGAEIEVIKNPFGKDGDVIYDNIDIQKSSARAIGNAGADDAVIIDSGDTLDIAGITGTGNVVLVSVSKNEAGDFDVVTSRHMLLSGKPIFSQSYGKCVVWN